MPRWSPGHISTLTVGLQRWNNAKTTFFMLDTEVLTLHVFASRSDTRSGHILLWKLNMKSFSKSFPPSTDSRSELSVTGESMGTQYFLTAWDVCIRLTDHPDMTIVVYRRQKTTHTHHTRTHTNSILYVKRPIAVVWIHKLLYRAVTIASNSLYKFRHCKWSCLSNFVQIKYPWVPHEKIWQTFRTIFRYQKLELKW